MRFPQLCARLMQELGKALVFSPDYPELGITRAEFADLSLWAHDGIYEVGGVEKGEWRSLAQCSTEPDACEYIYAALARNASMGISSKEGNARSAEISDAFNTRMRKHFEP